jgi:hypothetical protein
MACRAAADVDEPVWFGANCSQWAGEQVYPDLDCYLTSDGDASITHPWKDLRVSAGMPGAFSWSWFLEERLGDGAVAAVWQRCAEVAGANTWEACQYVFEDHGVAFEDGFMEYSMWRFLTDGYWIESCGFGPEAEGWEPGPGILDGHCVSSLPDSVSWSGSDETDPESWGLNWIRVDLSACQDGWVRLDFDGRDGLQWRLGALLWRDDACAFGQHEVPQPSGELSVSVAAGGWDYAVFYPAQLAETTLEGSFCGWLSYSTGVEGGGSQAQAAISISINPIVPGSAVELVIPRTGPVSLAAYDLSGRRVQTIVDRELAAGSHSIALDASGMAGGVYLLVLRTEKSLLVRKAVVAR